MSKKGLFIVFEGLDKSGKTTQSNKLVENLVKNIDVIVHKMSFPARETPLGQVINSYLTSKIDLSAESAHLLFSANRWELADQIKAQLSRGEIIVCDRYYYSGIAYSTAKGLPLNWCANSDQGLPEPDIVLYMCADAEELNTRGDFGAEKYERIDFQKKVAASFEQLYMPNWHHIDATESPDIIEKIILDKIKSML
jgi:dTMP kinase